jgi:curved DNA-binding protein CbpA
MGQVMESKSQTRRYPRIKAPKELLIAWRSAGQRSVSHAEAMGLGGMFLYTRNPLAKGSMIDLIIDVGSEGIRARGTVRDTTPGTGMGLQFVQMHPEDRARLSRFLKAQETVSNEQTVRAEPSAKAAWSVAAEQEPPSVVKPEAELRFESEVKSMLEIAQRGTYYQLLGLTPEASRKKVKESFYALARKFHPDRHMGSNSVESLQKLMEAITAAYKTLTSEQAKASYDKMLTASGAFSLERAKSESQETVEEYLRQATQCLNARNFAGSIVWLRKCVAIAPEIGKYRAMLARSLANVKGYRNEAIEQFERAIKLDPWNTTAYLQFAELYENMRLPWRARPLYRKVLEIDPQHPRACERLAKLDSEDNRRNRDR